MTRPTEEEPAMRRIKGKPKAKAPPKRTYAPKSEWVNKYDALYAAGVASEQAQVVLIVAAPLDAVVTHVDRVMVYANGMLELEPENAAFWRGVSDVAWKFYTLRRKRTRGHVTVYTEVLA